MILMEVGVDLDCTIRDISTALVSVYLTKYPEHKGKFIPINKWDIYSFSPYFPIGEKIQDFFAEHPDEISKISKPFDGAVDFMKKLCEISKVTIVTYQRNRRWEEVSIKWLEKQKIQFHNTVFLKDKTKFKGNFLLDDCVSNLMAVKLAGKCIPVCRDYFWNKDWDGLRVKKYNEFLSMVNKSLRSLEAT